MVPQYNEYPVTQLCCSDIMFFSTSFDPSTDLQDLSGKVVLVTGANTGIGYATVKHLARKGATVYLGSRSETKGNEAVEKLKKEGIDPGKVVLYICDLGTPVSAKQSAEFFLSLEERLDILVNNAACTYDTVDSVMKDGITEMAMTNHFGTFQFTTTLLPLLIKTSQEPDSDVRIITVSSEGHQHGPGARPDVDFKSFDVFKETYVKDMIPFVSRYALSKLANIVFSNALQRRLSSSSLSANNGDSSNIICISLHPGTVNTSFATRFYFPSLVGFITYVFFKTPDEGAYNSCFAAASPIVREEEEKYKGAYLMPVGRIGTSAAVTRDVQVQDRLWGMTEVYLAMSSDSEE